MKITPQIGCIIVFTYYNMSAINLKLYKHSLSLTTLKKESYSMIQQPGEP